jgi:hypothetical protein
VLLNADPLSNIANSRKIAGVFLSGRYLDRKELDAMMADLAKRNKAGLERFDWDRLSNELQPQP